MQSKTLSARTCWHVVLNATLEVGYPDDPLSPPREVVDFTVHPDRPVAVSRLLAELDLNLHDGQAMALRRSWLLTIEVPNELGGNTSPGRWLSDRTPELLRRAGSTAGALLRPSARSAILADDLAIACASLRTALGGDALEIAAAALATAGAARRAVLHDAIRPDVATMACDTAQAVGVAAWNNERIDPIALDALIHTLTA